MTNLEFNSICRLCVQVFEKEKFFPIFNNKSYENKISLPERIKCCSSIEVFQDDGLPPQVCNDCLVKLNKSFVFRNQCVLADITLKHLMNFNFSLNEIPNLSKIDTEDQIISSGNDDILNEIYSWPEKFKNEINNKESIDKFDSIKNGRHKKNIQKVKNTSWQKENSSNKNPEESNENLSSSESVKQELFTSSMVIILKKKRPNVNQNSTNTKIIKKKDNEPRVAKHTELNIAETPNRELREQNKSDTIYVNKIIEDNSSEYVSSDFRIEKIPEESNKDIAKFKSAIPIKRKKRKLKRKKSSFFRCEHCEKVYPSEGGWRYHVHTMHNENYQPFICDLCGDAFKVKKNLVAHKNSIHFHIKHHLCDLCGRGFASKYSLKVHKSWHNDERNFTCEICGTKFRTRGRLNSHRSIHGGPKKYMCHFCSREFRWKKDFEIHIRTHTGEKPFKCSHCGKAFASSTNRKKHEKNHLKKEELDEVSNFFVLALPTEQKSPPKL